MNKEKIKSYLPMELRIIRKRKKLTLKQLSKMTKISYPYLSEIERGISNPTIVVLEKIAVALEWGISLTPYPKKLKQLKK